MKENRRFIVESWLTKYESIFNNNGLDRWFKFPLGTMQKFYKYNRELKNKRINKIYRSVEKLISDFEELKTKSNNDTT
ncbi:hypothetical protein [Aquimarina aquimarini]|uniref:hypothetical protein n=1 Tax=Aquimarina aquimarini TaxID=1191734 RepID=UPI001F36237E|nr:hypothetical protein [Aquimarina aquimarini]